jgi:hypothetical protein
MASIDTYLSLGTMAVSVGAMTGKASDGAAAAGYSAWVESITGSVPKVLALPQSRAKVVLTDTQAQSMRTWIDNQIAGSLRPGEPPSLEIEFGPVIKPLLIKYAVLYGAVVFAVGVIVSRAFK